MNDNGLALAIFARCIEISENSVADIICEYSSVGKSLSVRGYKEGYSNAPDGDDNYPTLSFIPLGKNMGCVQLDSDNAEELLRNLLSELDNLEKELTNNG